LLLIIIVLAVFARSYRYEFLNYDDGLNVFENPHVKQFDLSYFWKKPYEGMYIPLTYNLWAFQAKLAKIPPAESAEIELKPHVFHTTNIIVHLLSMLVVFSILRILVRNDWAACAGALLFAIHPVQVEPVVWVTGLKNVLSGLLSLLAIWQYLSYASLNSPRTASAGRLKGHRQQEKVNRQAKAAPLYCGHNSLCSGNTVNAYRYCCALSGRITQLFDTEAVASTMRRRIGSLASFRSAHNNFDQTSPTRRNHRLYCCFLETAANSRRCINVLPL
jgi:hypothetical protein